MEGLKYPLRFYETFLILSLSFTSKLQILDESDNTLGTGGKK